MATLNCGDCLMDRAQVVELINGICPKCGANHNPPPSPKYRIESAINGVGSDLTATTDHYAAALLVEQAGETRRAGGMNIWKLYKDNKLVAQVRVWEQTSIYWASRSFGFRFEGLTVELKRPD